jgi:hypothetical protein
MHSNEILSLPRLFAALRADAAQHLRSFLIAGGAGAALVFVTSVASGGSAAQWSFHVIFYQLALLIGGYLFTSSLYADAHQVMRAQAYLTLPISPLERLLGRLLLSTLGYVAVSLVGYFAVTALAAGVSELIWGTSHGLFVPGRQAWQAILLYLVTSSVFLFGALYFRRLHAFKVIMSGTLLGLGVALLATGVAWLLFRGSFENGVNFTVDLLVDAPRMASAIVVAARIFLWGLLAPLFWLLAFLRLRELEV